MAASVTTTATTLEAQVFEVVQELQLLEQAVTTEPIPNNVTIDPNVDALTVTLTITLPMTFSVGTGGKMEISAGTYV